MKYRDNLSGQQKPWTTSGCQEGIQGNFAIKKIVFFPGQLCLATARQGLLYWVDPAG